MHNEVALKCFMGKIVSYILLRTSNLIDVSVEMCQASPYS